MWSRIRSSLVRSVGGAMLLSVSLTFSLVLVEGLLRVFPGLLSLEVLKEIQDDPRRKGISHPYIGHLHTPNHTGSIWGSDFKATYHTDGYGFRNAWPWPKQAEIVVLGDSLVFGYGVEDQEVWPALLGRALPQLRVMNLGLIGAGPQQYLRVYETFGMSLSPKLLLIGLFLDNDFWDAGLFDRWSQSGVGGNYMVWRDFDRDNQAGFDMFAPISSIQRIFARNSYLYHVLHHARNTYRSWSASEPHILRFADGSRLYLRPSNLASNMTRAEPDQPEFQLVLQALARIQALARENGTHVLLVFQPGREEAYMSLLGEAAPDPGRHLRAALDGLDIDYLDLGPPFRQRAAAGERLFFEADNHPNRRGYRLIAQEVLAYLNREAITYGLDGSKISSRLPEGSKPY